MANLQEIIGLTRAQFDTLYENGTITINGETLNYSEDVLYLVETADGEGSYILPQANNTTLGGIKIGYTASGANIPVKLSSEKAYVALTSSAVISALSYTPIKASDLSGYATKSENTANLTEAKNYTDTKIAALINSSPATLDTLDELAAALGDDPNFATTVSTKIGNNTSAITALQTTVAGKLEKTTYEKSAELACGSNGKVCLGKFGAYDTNITIELNSTTHETYHATIVIHSQNVVANGTGGTVGCYVYGDADNHVTPLISVFRPYGSASRQIEVYANLSGWSKNLVHVQAVALSDGGMTDVLTSVSEIPTAISGKTKVTPVNVLTTAFLGKTAKAASASVADSANAVAWGNVSSKPSFATVATSGSYNDLTNKPTIPAAYSLPTASSSTLGGIKTGYATSGKNYKVDVDSNGNAYVNVPWTDNNTTYTLGSFGITATATELNYTDGVTSNIQTQLNGKAASSHTHKIDTLTAGYLNTHPENSPTILPFIYNDLAFLTSKGGAISCYTTTDTSYTANSLTKATTVSASGNLFDGSPSYFIMSTTGEFTLVIDLTLHKTFPYSNNFYIDFGNAGWRAKNISVLAKNSATETAYTLKGSVTNQGYGFWYTSVAHSSKNSSGTTVEGFNCLRIVLSGWNNTSSTSGKRISQIGLINYGSAGVTETFVSRGGSSMYGNLTPYSNKGASLGTSSLQWNNIYGATIYEGGTALSSKYLGISSKAASATVADSANSVAWGNVTNKPSILSPAGGTLNDGATLKFSTYGTRFITISGNSINADMSGDGGTWAGAFATVKDAKNVTTTMLGWYGSKADGLYYIYMGGAYNDPFMKMTTAGQFTFKNTPYVGSTSLALSSDVSTALNTAKSYTDTKVAALVDSSPDTLNTLNELAAALGDDPNFATTVATQIGGKLGKTEKAADSDKLDGQDSSYYLNYNNLSNKPTIPAAYTLPTRLQEGSTSGYNDANQATAQGWHYMSSTATNRPPFKQVDGLTGYDYRIMTTAYSTSWLQQIATDFRSNDVFIRRNQNGSWQGWTALVKMQQGLNPPVGTNNAIVRWDSSRNATIKDSNVTIDDSGVLNAKTLQENGTALSSKYQPKIVIERYW